MVIEERTHFDQFEFKHEFLGKKSVIYRGQIKHWAAVEHWGFDYFADKCPDILITAKIFNKDSVDHKVVTMANYVASIKGFEEKYGKESNQIKPYCHDVPIFLLAEKLINDVGQFPWHILPEWYQTKWWKYVQFFMSAKGSVTPLHFDTLMTNNMFFEIKGTKRFTLINGNDAKHCFRRGWRWFDVDPERVLPNQRNKFSNADIGVVDVRAGDMFYMPGYMLHHVRSLEACISFNIDFHTIPSVLKSFMAISTTMPKRNLYYNLLSCWALLRGGEQDDIFDKYRSYLNYVS